MQPWRGKIGNPFLNTNLSGVIGRRSAMGSRTSRSLLLWSLLLDNSSCDQITGNFQRFGYKQTWRLWLGQGFRPNSLNQKDPLSLLGAGKPRIVIAKCSGSTVVRANCCAEDREKNRKLFSFESHYRNQTFGARRLETKCPLPLQSAGKLRNHPFAFDGRSKIIYCRYVGKLFPGSGKSAWEIGKRCSTSISDGQ